VLHSSLLLPVKNGRRCQREARSERAIVPAKMISAVVMEETVPDIFIFEYYEYIHVSFAFN
jgi:hypothetical protein